MTSATGPETQPPRSHPGGGGAAGGEMARRVEAFDWGATPLGAREGWSQSLRTAVGICLSSRFPITLFLGPELVQLYNDAYRPVLGASKHPRALGSPARIMWPEIWDTIGPMLEGVMAGGDATYSEDLMLVLDRNAEPEECWFTFGYSPIHGEGPAPIGVFCAVAETTDRVVGERRLRALRSLTTASGRPASVDDALRRSVTALAASEDVAFALVYRVEDDGGLRLSASTGIPVGHELAPPHIAAGAAAPWPTAGPLAGRPLEAPTDPAGRLRGALPGRPPASVARLEPISMSAGEAPLAVLVAGLNPLRPLDEPYRDFLGLVARQMGSSAADARAYVEATARADALTELDGAKNAFFGNMSHEFRTPLTLLIGPLEDEIAERGGAGPATERLRLAHRGALRLLKLVTALLDVSRLESGRGETRVEPTDLAALTAELGELFRPAVERGGLRLRVDCPPLSGPVHVDREMWERIVLNLLGNALKFTLEGEVAVTLREADGQAVLSVADTGVGIPEAELPLLFRRFHRVRGLSARTEEGTGIGLSLVRDLAELHGGAVEVRSAVGRGSTFTVRIPIGTAHLDPARIAPPRERAEAGSLSRSFVEEALRWGEAGDEVSLDAALGERHTAARDGLARVPGRVLIADDSADMRAYLTRVLGERFDVVAVADGAQALDEALAHPPDLLLSDMMMPGVQGVWLVRALRRDRRTAEMPIVLLSARAGEDASVAALEAGADDYLVKPFTARELVARVGAHLELGRTRREARAALAASEARFRHMADTAPVLLWLTDASGAATYVNRGWLDFTGRRLEAELGDGWLDRVHPDDVARCREVQAAARAVREPFDLELRLRRADGAYRWLLCRGVPVVADGEGGGYIGSCIDITERRRAEGRRARMQRLQVAVADGRTRAQVARAVLAEYATAVGAAAGSLWFSPHPATPPELLGSFGYAAGSDRRHGRAAVGSAALEEALDAEGTVWLTDEAEQRALDPALADAARAHGLPGLAVTRLEIDGRARGLVLVAPAVSRPAADGEIELLDGMARQAAQALERARLHEAEMQIAETLQRSLLPASLPEVPGLHLAARYRAAAEHVEVGGDWYEAVMLPGGALCLAVGDVVGRGLVAATVMGQLRSAMRALALEGVEPDLLLQRLNRFALGIDAGGIATAACVVLHPEGDVRYACAGHPPPLVVGPADGRRFLEEGRSPPLATSADSVFAAGAARLEPGETLLIYTDGLIERRRESLDEGLARLARSAGDAHALSPDELADLVIAELLGARGNNDDVALLAARRTSDEGRFQRTVSAVPAELATLRRGVRDFLAAEDVGDPAAHDVLLACAEAAANAVEHAFTDSSGAGTVTVEIARVPGGLDIIVRDDGRWRNPSETPLRGMGVPIMREVMDDVSVATSEAGTVVTMRWRRRA